MHLFRHIQKIGKGGQYAALSVPKQILDDWSEMETTKLLFNYSEKTGILTVFPITGE